MIKHIVLWKLHEYAGGKTGSENGLEVKRLIEGMTGKIPGVIKLEVGLNFNSGPDDADIVLYSEFDDKQALELYQVHPVHEAIKEFIKSVRSERHVIDYEV